MKITETQSYQIMQYYTLDFYRDRFEIRLTHISTLQNNDQGNKSKSHCYNNYLGKKVMVLQTIEK